MFDDGFNKASGDWVIKMDIDTIIHEKDFDSLYASMKTYKDYPALSMRKFQFFTPFRFHTKSRMGMVLNKKRFKNVKFNGGGDGCDPTVNGIHINEKNVPRVKIPFWNYDSTFKTKEVISEDRARFARAWHRTFGDYGDRGGPDPEVAFDALYKMVNERFSKHVFKSSISDHPIFIQSKLKSLNENHFGFNLFGLNEKVKRSPLNYFDAIKEKTGDDISKMNEDELVKYCKSKNIETNKSMGRGKLFDAVLGEFCEKELIQPTYITDYPIEMSPLTKKHRSKEGLTERFELFINGKEIANAYSEQNNPIEQRKSFEDQMRLAEKGDDEAMLIDNQFLTALEYGMPPTSGIGIGMDRLTMLLTNKKTIQDVLFFPQMKPENK